MEYLGTEKPINKIQPTVSVCVETYRHVNYIRQCLDSILEQKTDFPFEIIVGEDESTDGTREICKEYAEKHPDKVRLFLRYQKDVIRINGTATGRYNLIQNIKEARGKYIAHCAGDDYWIDPLKLQKQVDFLENNPNYNLSMGRVKILQEEKEQIILKKEYVNPKKNESYTFKDYIKKGPFSVVSTFLYRNMDFKFPEWFNEVIAGDQCIVMFMAGNDPIIMYHNDFFAIYRINNANITKKRNRQTIENEALFLCDKINEYTQFRYNKVIKFRKFCAKLSGKILAAKNQVYKKSLIVILLISRSILRSL